MELLYMMTDEKNCSNPIIATLVPEGRRLHILPRYFGNRSRRGEALVYYWMRSFCQEYDGGYWEFYELSNGVFFMAPKMGAEATFRLVNPMNYFEGGVSPEAAGLIVCLMAFSALAAETEEDRYIILFDKLRDYALQHSEAGSIFRAID